MSVEAVNPDACPYCGNIHKALCPRIKRIEYSEMNPERFKVVEFFAPNDYAPLVGMAAPAPMPAVQAVAPKR